MNHGNELENVLSFKIFEIYQAIYLSSGFCHEVGCGWSPQQVNLHSLPVDVSLKTLFLSTPSELCGS